MFIQILTPSKEVYSNDQVEAVTFPGLKGSFTVLKNHTPIISQLKLGKILIKRQEKIIAEIKVDGGFCEVNNNKISVIIKKVIDG